MNFKTKANNMFKIISRYNQGKYEGTFEVIDTANSRVEAYYMLDEYEMAFGNKYELDVLEE